MEDSDAADAEDELLVEAGFASGGVELAGDDAVLGGVTGVVGVHQEERGASDLEEPDSDEEFSSGEGEFDGELVSIGAGDGEEGVVVGVEGWEEGFLAPGPVDDLVEEASAVEASDSDEGESEVGGFFDVVSGEDAESSGVLVHGGVEGVFGAEVGDDSVAEVESGLGEPGLVLGV